MRSGHPLTPSSSKYPLKQRLFSASWDLFSSRRRIVWAFSRLAIARKTVKLGGRIEVQHATFSYARRLAAKLYRQDSTARLSRYFNDCATSDFGRGRASAARFSVRCRQQRPRDGARRETLSRVSLSTCDVGLPEASARPRRGGDDERGRCHCDAVAPDKLAGAVSGSRAGAEP